jgi:flagellar hook-length control protein FliK
VDLVIAGFSQVSSAPAAACAGGADTESPATATLFAELLDQLGVAHCAPVPDVQEGANVSTAREAARGPAASGDPAVADGAAADSDDESEEDDVASDVPLIVCTAQPRYVLDTDVPVVPRVADNADLSGGADRRDLPDARSGADLSRTAEHVDSPDFSRASDCADSPDLPRVTDRAELPETSRRADRAADLPDAARAVERSKLPNFSRAAHQADQADLPGFTRVIDHADPLEFIRVADRADLPESIPVPDGADLPDFSRLANRVNLAAALTRSTSDPSALTTEPIAGNADRQSRVQGQPHSVRALARALAGVATERSAEVPNSDGQRVRESDARIDEASAVRTAVSLSSVLAPVAQSELAEPRPIAMPETRRHISGEHEIVPQLVRAMHAQFRAGVGEARIRLNPEHLGEVRVAITIDGDRVSALLQVERPEVQRAIESQSDSLRSGLAAQGFTLEHLSVSREDRARHPGGDDLEHRARNREQQLPQRRSKKRPYDEVFDISETS